MRKPNTPVRYDRFTIPQPPAGTFEFAVKGYLWWRLKSICYAMVANSDEQIFVYVLDNAQDALAVVGGRLYVHAADSLLVQAALGLSECSQEVTNGATSLKTGYYVTGSVQSLGLPDVEQPNDGFIFLPVTDAASQLLDIVIEIEGQRIGDDA